ncbi:hypothetical protein HALLA_12685 [Halostagnicola larsenii XH-48]|uniref:Uncharacterized protein n=1 Tax=Halostagnicola larsenii XH-48 TaxID=797299 RepID=W0JUR0_9EURY|nr:hypothetical protein [Halostagnicola larsenii]AHG01000.1 hypothetical protein HALLA_12685 [Halostagnicola larsenii XH-48]
MVPNLSRRSLAVTVLGGITVTGAANYGWRQYKTRNYLDLRILGRNRSDEATDIAVTVLEDGDPTYEQTAELEPAGDDEHRDEQHLPGPWIKQHEPYSLEITALGESVALSNEEIIDQLEDAGWGVESVRVTAVVTENRTLETNVESRE